MAEGGTQPAQSKNEAFSKIERPNTWGNLRMLIGLFVFYCQFFPLYYLDIRTWRYIFLKQNQLGTIFKEEYMPLMHNLWDIEDQSLLEQLKEYIYEDLI